MTTHKKISAALTSLFNSEPDESRDAVVIYQPPPAAVPLRGNLRELQTRLREIKRTAAAQQPIQNSLSERYTKVLQQKSNPTDTPVIQTIGKSSLPVARMQVTSNSLHLLETDPNVIAVLPNLRIRLIQPKMVSYTALARTEAKDGQTWGLKHLEVRKVWEKSKGAGVSVAVLDTGVHSEHPALADRVKKFIVVDPLGRRIKTDRNFDSDQHGTHVCGTIAGGKTPEGVSIGIAPEADLLVGAVLIGNSSLVTLLEGIDWAIESGANILSMSLGFSYYEPRFTEVFKVLLQRFGIVPVAAIGNENYGNSSSPGNAYNALSVGAVENMGKSKLDVAFFSSGVSLVKPAADADPFVTKPDIVAPGVQVYSAIPPVNRQDGTYEYTYMDGTSMATPHVSGVVALLMAAEPMTPVTDIIDAIKSTAKHPAGDERPDNRWGFGMIRPVEALKALQS